VGSLLLTKQKEIDLGIQTISQNMQLQIVAKPFVRPMLPPGEYKKLAISQFADFLWP